MYCKELVRSKKPWRRPHDHGSDAYAKKRRPSWSGKKKKRIDTPTGEAPVARRTSQSFDETHVVAWSKLFHLCTFGAWLFLQRWLRCNLFHSSPFWPVPLLLRINRVIAFWLLSFVSKGLTTFFRKYIIIFVVMKSIFPCRLILFSDDLSHSNRRKWGTFCPENLCSLHSPSTVLFIYSMSFCRKYSKDICCQL